MCKHQHPALLSSFYWSRYDPTSLKLFMILLLLLLLRFGLSRPVHLITCFIDVTFCQSGASHYYASLASVPMSRMVSLFDKN